MTERAQLTKTEHGLKPEGPGWFVVHTSEARWWRHERFGTFTSFEGDSPTGSFPEVGINIHIIEPDQPACLYHRENAQENFLVLSGECRVLIEEEELALRAGHFVHCPAGATHVFVGAGSGPCAVLMIGRRPEVEELCYPVSELARKHGASAEAETTEPKVAYGASHGARKEIEPLWPVW